MSFRKTFLSITCAVLLSGVGVASAQENVRTLQETLQGGQAALVAGDYAGAYAAFEAIQKDFAREPEVQAQVFQITITPLHAYAALLSENADRAIELFESFVTNFPDDRTRLSFVLFNLARAYSETGNPDQAIDTYRRFVALDPERPEASLATLQAVQLMFETGKDDEAFEALDALYERQPDGTLGTKARLTALQEALERDRVQEARRYILESDWSVTNMPELAVLAFAALDMGQKLLDTRQYEDAIHCFRLVPPYQQLLEAQQRRLAETRERFESRRQSIGLYQGGQFWTQFYTRLIQRLEAQLRGLQAAEDYSPALYLSYGQAYLLAGRPREAWIIFENQARDESLTKQQQSEAHYRWILAAVEVGVWEDAFKIAKGFGRRFPESPLVPDALYLLANAYQEARLYRDAIDVLTHFLDTHGDHPLAPRVLFVRGYNYNLMSEPALAREDFEAFIQRYPQHGLVKDARLWRALSFFAERDYDTTLEALTGLARDVVGERLEPEVAYRRAATLYAMREYERALTAIRSYLDKYPLHSRADEGRVLLGDIEMGRGELLNARVIFMEIDPSAGHLFTYSVFQAGKIFRAVAGAAEDPEQSKRLLQTHLEHFQNYVAREDVPLKDRLSEALYWIGWTYLEQGDEAQARSVFADALERYGDDVDSEDVPSIIDAFARIEKRLVQVGRSEREARLRSWVEEQKAQALADERLTYYARLNLYLQAMLPPEDPTSLVFQIVENVPIERIDAQGLGQVASALVEKYPNVAEDYLLALEDRYPESRHRSYGYYTRAKLLMQAGEYADARWQLSRFRTESPQHPLAIPVALDYAHTLTLTQDFAEAQTVLEDLLRVRQAKGRPHAEALLALSRNAEASGDLKRAVPYAQRVFNVYRAYADLAAEAYWLSAQQFEALGDMVAAYKTLDEMLGNSRIAQLPIAAEAEAKRSELFAKLPAGALDAEAEEAAVEPAEVGEVAASSEPTAAEPTSAASTTTETGGTE